MIAHDILIVQSNGVFSYCLEEKMRCVLKEK